MKSDASSKTGRVRRPIVCIIGMCYVDSMHCMVMISVDMRVVGKMTPYAAHVTTKLRDLFVRGERRMAAFGFSHDKMALECAVLLQENAQGALSLTWRLTLLLW